MRTFRAGLALAAGIWTSDALYILLVVRGVDALASLTALPHFRVWAGLAGGVVLVAFGLTSLLRRQIPTGEDAPTTADRVLDAIDGPEPPGVAHNWMRWGLPGYWLRGFLLNTINPFTVFFWLGIGGSLVSMHAHERLSFFTGMFAVLIAADTLKAWGAKKLKQWLTPTIVVKIQKAIGFLLIVFGIAILVRVLGSPL